MRNLFKRVALGLSLITLLSILLSKRSQRIGDMVAGTIVVRRVDSMRRESSVARRDVPRSEGGAEQPVAVVGVDAAPRLEPPLAPLSARPGVAPAPRRGIAGFVLSLVGFLLPVVWPFGIVLAWRDMRHEKRDGQPHGLSLAALIISAAGTVVVVVVVALFFTGVPRAWLADLHDTPHNSAVKDGIHSIRAGIDAYAVDHGGAYPPAATRSRLADYVKPWPTNPYSLLPMTQGTDRGDYYYSTDGASYSLTGYGDDDKPIISLP